MPCPLLTFKYLEKCVSLLFQFPYHQPSTTGLFSLRKCRSFSCQSHWNLIITLFIALASLHLLWNFSFLHFTYIHTVSSVGSLLRHHRGPGCSGPDYPLLFTVYICLYTKSTGFWYHPHIWPFPFSPMATPVPSPLCSLTTVTPVAGWY